MARGDFAVRTRDELARLWPLGDRVAWAEMAGLVRGAGRLHLVGGHGRTRGLLVELAFDQPAVARKAYRLLRSVAGVAAEVWVRRGRGRGRGMRWAVRAPGGRPSSALARRLGILDGSGRLAPRVPAAVLRSRSLSLAFLRGLFLGCGSVADPDREHHLELELDDVDLAGTAASVLDRLGVPPHRGRRREREVLYWKDAEVIARLLRLLGAREVLFGFEEARIRKQMRSDVNRLVNAETANLEKAVAAALRQIADIHALRAAGALERLPEGLRQVAELRLAHPELSLSELGGLLRPPLGKSGVNHRLRRLRNLAERLGPVAEGGPW